MTNPYIPKDPMTPVKSLIKAIQDDDELAIEACIVDIGNRLEDSFMSRHRAMEGILLILQTAPRQGADKDEPEGARFITLSATLVDQMIATIKATIEK